MSRDFDLVLFGATGFTGRLVADYLANAADKPRWAIAGRSQAKLDALGLNVPALVVDTLDRAQVAAIVKRSKVVCTTVGPYAKYGSELLAACADAGTHYCDLTGEPQWMRRMIDQHHERAKQTNARIVHTCGFDSIPSDIGTFAVQQEFHRVFGRYATKVTALFGETSGGLSGGTIASAMETAREAGKDIAVRKNLGNPYGLDPDPEASKASRPRVRDETGIGWEPHLKMFTIPFVMAQINTRVVRRGHALAGCPYGEDFVYREVMSTPGRPGGLAMAVGMMGGLAGIAFAMKRPKLRDMLAKRVPQPGEDPADSGLAQEQSLARTRDVALGEEHIERHEQVEIELAEVHAWLRTQTVARSALVRVPAWIMGTRRYGGQVTMANAVGAACSVVARSPRIAPIRAVRSPCVFPIDAPLTLITSVG